MQTTVLSFGYKHGLPLDVDLVIDCRFLPNPHWVEELRPLTGLDEPVRDYVLGQEVTAEFLDELDAACSSCCCRPTWPRARAYLTDRLRLHRRAAPLGGHRRGGRARRLRRARATTRRSSHRDIDR